MQYLRSKPHRGAYEIRRTNREITKLDAPYTFFSIRGQASRIPASREVQAKKNNIRIAEESNDLIGRHPEISEKAAMKIARKASQKAYYEEREKNRKLQKLANRTAGEAKRGHYLERKASMMHQQNCNRDETENGSTFAVRFTSNEPELPRKATLQPEAPEAEKAPPITIKRHFSVSTRDLYQKHGTIPTQYNNVKTKSVSESKSLPEYHKNKNKPLQPLSPTSIPMVREESGDKSPVRAYKYKVGNAFTLRKHARMNPYERLQVIHRVGEITSRDQATGLHGQYHLKLFDEHRKTLRYKVLH